MAAEGRRAPFPPMPPRFRWASVLGGTLATLLFAWVLFVGKAEVTPAPTSDFYDLQARAWFDGRWDIADVTDPETGETSNPLSIEAFVVDGKSYTYFGPAPAVLRAPLLAITAEADGRLTQVSMMAAYVTALTVLAMLSWRIRCLVRGRVDVHRREAFVTGLFTFGLGAGTVLLYLGSQPVVYHEAVLWGVAFSLASYHALVEVIARPALRPILVAGLFSALAVLTRVSVGLGTVVALGLVLVVQVAAIVWSRGRARGSGASTAEDPGGTGTGDRVLPAFRALLPGASDEPQRGHLLALALVAVLPVLLYSGVNLARFDTPFRLPIDQQVFSEIDESRRAALDANDGSIFGLRYVPTTLLQYARPDAVEVDRLAPWLNFPRRPATVVGGAVFDTRDEASSVPATMPLLTVLAVVGLVAVVRPPEVRPPVVRPLEVRPPVVRPLEVREVEPVSSPSLAVLRIPVLGAAAGSIGVLAIAFIVHRYVGDVFPLLALLGLAGLHRCGRSFGGDPAPASVAAGAGLLLLGLWSVTANVALALEYQRLIAPVERATRWSFLETQYETFGGALEFTVHEAGGSPPMPLERGDLVVRLTDDSCRVLWSDGYSEEPVPDLTCVFEGGEVVDLEFRD